LVFCADSQIDRALASMPWPALTARRRIAYNLRPFGELAQLVRAEES
jgi:hypothetical protein